ncbi:putative ABC transport system permease protein [Natronincola peptidivorans]|uniref:Putative ABC transport system permease protein n=1 Tax=Natronincola peptidivorans TaxID=426128 RepID=A0A1H9ZXS8_9FIRM|nr:ABC transporter permease [Natronincola peptidivorans]SES86590.1 putative ABC transport system permease protein [Natronincola peptidivorans]
MLLIETLRVALQSIWANKMRSSLTVLGLVIGILSVVVITTLGNAAQADMTSVFDAYGKGKLSVGLRHNNDRPAVYRDYFSDEDITAVGRMETDVFAVSPELSRWMTMSHGNKQMSIDMYGVNQNYHEVETVDIIRGRFLTEEDVLGRRNVMVIDEKAARYLFGSTDCIGEIVTLTTGWHTVELMIIGVDKLLDSAILNMAMGNYAYGYMPITLATRMDSIDRYPMLLLQAQEGLETNIVGERVLSLLERRNKERDMYRVYSHEDDLSQVNEGIGFLTLTVSGIAGISLLVGGIGIMNIMLVSVTERTREIGIRKAIGAKPSVILLQFLVEAVILSLFGGILGLSIGGLISFGIVGALGLPFVISKGAIIMAFVFSTTVGIVFGVYPANKASKLDPIEALRYE